MKILQEVVFLYKSLQNRKIFFQILTGCLRYLLHYFPKLRKQRPIRQLSLIRSLLAGRFPQSIPAACCREAELAVRVPVTSGNWFPGAADFGKERLCVLELNHIVKKYDDHVILDDLSLTIQDGEIISILEPSGGGKTTLLNCILGITPINSGSIVCDGVDVSRVPMKKRGFNIVFQDYALFPNLTAYENIVYGLRNHPDISSPQEVKDLVCLLDLQEHVNKNIDQLSGGQKQRVALARTLVMKPKILLLDEPLSALDGVIKESIKAKIRQIADHYRLTTIIVTHDPEEALTMSDRVLILNQGKISRYDTPEQIIHHPGNDFVKRFILSQLEIKRNNIIHLFA